VTRSGPERAADTLRTWALDEELRDRVMATPALAALARRVARRYMAGETVAEAIEAGRAVAARGHRVSLDYAGESVREADRARRETDVFLQLIAAIREAGLPATVSFDLSHVGAIVEPGLGLAHAREMARATADLSTAGTAGTALMVSAEASDRTDLVLGLYEELAREYPHVGITLQARLHRTPADLERVLPLPGVVRLVKGAFGESEEIAHPRDTDGLTGAYLGLARRLVEAGHPVSLATHDETLVRALIGELGLDPAREGVEFEMLMGLGTDLLDGLRREGYRTREYVSFGTEWWLYVLNRMAEHPERVITALADLA
jgi:proline dehydrogenase